MEGPATVGTEIERNDDANIDEHVGYPDHCDSAVAIGEESCDVVTFVGTFVGPTSGFHVRSPPHSPRFEPYRNPWLCSNRTDMVLGAFESGK